MTDQEVIDGRCDLEMLRRTHLWPHRIVCPMKRNKDGVLDLIVLVDRGAGDPNNPNNDANRHRYFVFEGPMFLSPHRRQQRKQVASGDDFLLRTLVDAGWVVD